MFIDSPTTTCNVMDVLGQPNNKLASWVKVADIMGQPDANLAWWGTVDDVPGQRNNTLPGGAS